MNTKTMLRLGAPLLLAALLAGAAYAAEPAAAHAKPKAAASAEKKPAAEKKTAKSKAPPLPSLVWRGDQTTSRAFMKDLAHEYETAHLGSFVLQPFSTISGLDAVYEGKADVAGSARPPMPGRNEEAGTNFYPIAWDALVMITSPKNPVSNVTLKQLHDIYLGSVTDWSQLGGEPGPINLYAVAGPLDGNEYSLRDLIFHHGDQAVAAPRLYVNVEKLEEGIAIDPHGLGLTTLSAAHANAGLKMLSVEGVAPTTASVADGSYPMYSTLFLASRDDSPHRNTIEKFVAFVGTEPAHAVLRRHGLVPYGDAPTLSARQAERIAYVDAHVRPEYAAAVAASAASTNAAPVGSIGSRPVSAPVATADMLIRTEPNTAEAQQAKDRAVRVMNERKQASDKPEAAGQ